jgi:hypothetical protein
MRITYCPIERGRGRGEDYCVDLGRQNARGDGKIMFDSYDLILCDISRNTCIIIGGTEGSISAVGTPASHSNISSVVGYRGARIIYLECVTEAVLSHDF